MLWSKYLPSGLDTTEQKRSLFSNAIKICIPTHIVLHQQTEVAMQIHALNWLIIDIKTNRLLKTYFLANNHINSYKQF